MAVSISMVRLHYFGLVECVIIKAEVDVGVAQDLRLLLDLALLVHGRVHFLEGLHSQALQSFQS